MRFVKTLLRTWALLGLAACVLALASPGQVLAQKGAKPAYVVRALAPTEGTAFDIQSYADFSEVVGQTAGTAHYWRLDAAGATTLSTDLLVGGVGSHASGINSQGVIVGNYWTGIDSRPLAWKTFAAAPIELPVPEGVVNAGAENINDSGLVIGYLVWENEDRGIAAWQLGTDADGGLVVHDAIVLGAGFEVGRGGVNNDGQAVGTLDLHAWRWHVAWNPELNGVGGLEVLAATQLFPGFSSATGINEAGAVCGQYLNAATGRKEAYVLEPNGAFHPLTLRVSSRETAENVIATAINDASPVQVVGEGQILRGNLTKSRPSVRWDLNGGYLTLPLDSAPFAWHPLYAINDAGWAVGSAKVDGSTSVLPVLLRSR